MKFLAICVLLALLALLGACASDDSPAGSSAASPSPSESALPSQLPSQLPSGSPSPRVTPQPDRSDTPACDEVRAGIDDFNKGDFEGTVDHFRTAEPLARSQAAADSSSSAQDLLEAVRYYADLAPKDYPLSAASSADFAKYKAITLGQCVAGAEPADPAESESPGVTA